MSLNANDWIAGMTRNFSARTFRKRRSKGDSIAGGRQGYRKADTFLGLPVEVGACLHPICSIEFINSYLTGKKAAVFIARDANGNL